MIEISNEELAKVLNLWTGTEDWRVCYGTLECSEWIQRKSDGTICSPIENSEDKEAHTLVKFMLKERKYPDGDSVFYMSDGRGPLRYVEWVKDWEKRFGNMSQEELCIPLLPSEVEVSKSFVVEDPQTKAERFYSFLTTPQPDISPGLWGIEREAEPLTIYSEEVCRQCLGMGKFDGVLCVKDGCKARL